jgi:hypothetical protein
MTEIRKRNTTFSRDASDCHGRERRKVFNGAQVQQRGGATSTSTIACVKRDLIGIHTRPPGLLKLLPVCRILF